MEVEQSSDIGHTMDSKGNIWTLESKLTYSIITVLSDDWNMELVALDSDEYTYRHPEQLEFERSNKILDFKVC